MTRDPWAPDRNPHQSLYAAILITIEDAPPGVIPPDQRAEAAMEALRGLVPADELEELRAAVRAYRTEAVCSRCVRPSDRLYLWRGRALCGSCRAHLAAAARWGRRPDPPKPPTPPG